MIIGDPTPAQAEAGNYQKAHLRFAGLEITIENPRGSIRSGKGWAVWMQHHYGYIKRTLGVDGDQFDCLLGPDETAPMVYLVTTKAPPDFKVDDEQKALIGFPSKAAARSAFLAMYDDRRFLGQLTAMPIQRFRDEVRTTRAAPRMLKALPAPLFVFLRSNR